MGPTTHYGVNHPIAGIVLLVFSTWALSGLDAGGKWVMGFDVPLLVLCWVRYSGRRHYVAAA